ncbi:LysR family transcriptional regulator [Microbacterium suwonense]|uniref:HTH lysR-type domain-containing protein n=1 Tax=Microbacterium suwonense TaxID=683047 RepID=A0ABM8FNT5_9MICO|nr:hypothetical protein GCM10025863_00200 [Microbacterium suwonense]
MRIDAQLAATVAAAIDEGSFDAAARRLHITPSAVSQRIKAVEQQLGRVVVVRSRPVRATEAGRPSSDWRGRSSCWSTMPSPASGSRMPRGSRCPASGCRSP